MKRRQILPGDSGRVRRRLREDGQRRRAEGGAGNARMIVGDKKRPGFEDPGPPERLSREP